MVMFSKEAMVLTGPCYEAIKKISKGQWKWKPEVGEWCIYKKNNEIALIVFHWPKTESNKYETIEVSFSLGANRGIEEFADGFTPLLHWERIEEILEGMGYRLTVGVDPEVKPFKTGFECWIGTQERARKYEQFVYIRGIKSRQLVVMKAAIELADKTKKGGDDIA